MADNWEILVLRKKPYHWHSMKLIIELNFFFDFCISEFSCESTYTNVKKKRKKKESFFLI